MKKKVKKFTARTVRKSAHLTRMVLSVGANYSGRLENKAHRIINGTDASIKLHDKVLFEQLYYEALPYVLPMHPALPKAGRNGEVTLFIPSLQKSSFFGGTATALIFTGLLAVKKSQKIRIVETLQHGRTKAEQLVQFFSENNISINVDNIELVDASPRKYNNYGYINIHPDDTFIASAWWDAYILEKLPLQKKFIYLIQDYEPIFYANSDRYIMAEATYKSEQFIPVCNTELMYKFMASKGYKYIEENALWFEPAIGVGEKVGKSIAKEKNDKRKMFIYGRPSVERNLFYTALKSINEVFLNQDLDSNEWEIYMAGQDNINNIQLESGIVAKNLGKMDIDEYYQFARTIDVAISLMMAPHPSYPPLEFSSIGAGVVTSAYETKQDLSKYSKNIFVSKNYNDLSDLIIKASKLSYEDRIKNTQSSIIGADWKKSLKDVIEKVSK
jgi:hypothetical protein